MTDVYANFVQRFELLDGLMMRYSGFQNFGEGEWGVGNCEPGQWLVLEITFSMTK